MPAEPASSQQFSDKAAQQLVRLLKQLQQDDADLGNPSREIDPGDLAAGRQAIAQAKAAAEQLAAKLKQR
jgi:hypothetical protein